jgi:hypothetical protein
MSWAECAMSTGGCGLVFASDASFDKHRRGSFEPDTRRCLSLGEMAEGLPVRRNGKGTTWRQNRHGYWTHEKLRSDYLPGLRVEAPPREEMEAAAAAT